MRARAPSQDLTQTDIGNAGIASVCGAIGSRLLMGTAVDAAGPRWAAAALLMLTAPAVFGMALVKTPAGEAGGARHRLAGRGTGRRGGRRAAGGVGWRATWGAWLAGCLAVALAAGGVLQGLEAGRGGGEPKRRA